MNDKEYYSLIQSYEDAMQMLLSRLDTFNHTLYESSEVHPVPVHHIQSRIKSKKSIEGKLKKKEKKATVQNVKDYLMDVAGVRVICYFVSDIYNLADVLKKQSDLVMIKERDYIENPKPNGYRSYHLVVGIPVYCLDGMEYFPVEIQFRTMSMDFWASMEHRINYKKEREDREKLVRELKEYAATLMDIEEGFERYNETGRREEGRDFYGIK